MYSSSNNILSFLHFLLYNQQISSYQLYKVSIYIHLIHCIYVVDVFKIETYIFYQETPQRKIEM